MFWVLILVWGVAVLIAAAVLAFCAYELSWKRRRLRGDLARLGALQQDLAQLGADIARAQARAGNPGGPG